MRAAAAISVHPVPSHATGEVIADILERFEERPDLALVCATPALAGALDDICAAVAEILDPVTLVGVTSSGILGGTTEVESGPGLSLWVATTGPSDARLFSPNTSSTSIADDIVDLISNSGAEEDGSGAVVLLMGDAVDFPATDVVEIVNARAPGAAIAGGLLSGWPGPSGVRLSVDGAVADGGGIAIVLAGVRFDIGVSHGCSPIGESMMITGAERTMIRTLDDRAALDVAQDALWTVDADRRVESARQLQLGVVVGAGPDGRREFDMLPVLGADRANGAIALGSEVPVGTLARFHVRDVEFSTEDLRRSVVGPKADGALVFTCTSRGEEHFGTRDHDAGIVSETLGTTAIGGVFCSARIGPIGGESRLLGFAVVTVIFGRGHH
jgi:small ligand-binding sensory domain FIST